MTSPRRELPLPIVAVVTDRSLFSGLTELYEAVEAAVAGGANLVQLREKDLPDAEQLIIARRLREITAGRALLLVNDSVSVAQAAGADGVQLAETSRSVSDARSRAGGAPLIIGRSVHNDAGRLGGIARGGRPADRGRSVRVRDASGSTARGPGVHQRAYRAGLDAGAGDRRRHA